MSIDDTLTLRLGLRKPPTQPKLTQTAARRVVDFYGG
jgi:hypothetical protein